MIEESSFYQMVLEKGIEKGIERGVEKGVETGRLEEARRNVRRVLALRFPSVGEIPELDSIGDADRLEQLLDAVVTAKDPKAAKSAIQRFTRRKRIH